MMYEYFYQVKSLQDGQYVPFKIRANSDKEAEIKLKLICPNGELIRRQEIVENQPEQEPSNDTRLYPDSVWFGVVD